MVSLREDRGLRLAPVRKITHIQSKENYSRVHLADARPALVRRSMAEWEQVLPKEKFLRAERSLIVQLASVREVKPESRDVARVVLAGQTQPLTLARRASLRIRQALDPR